MFVTTNVSERRPLFADSSIARETVEHLYRVQELHPFFLYAFVVMPDHCHFLLNVPPPGSISRIMNVFKSGLSFQIGGGRVWQPRFHLSIPEHASRVVDYIHLNPVRRRLCVCPEEYPWSSACGKWDVSTLDQWQGF